MKRMTPCRSRAKLAHVSNELAGMRHQLETRLKDENQGWERLEEAASGWEDQWDANWSRIARQMGILREWSAGTMQASPRRPRLSLVGPAEGE